MLKRKYCNTKISRNIKKNYKSTFSQCLLKLQPCKIGTAGKKVCSQKQRQTNLQVVVELAVDVVHQDDEAVLLVDLVAIPHTVHYSQMRAARNERISI